MPDRLTETDQRLPMYQRVKDALTQRLAEGEWSRAEPLPSETVLAAEYGVAIGTVRKALEGLVAEGLLERQQGRGTFLRRPSFGNALFRFFRLSDGSGAIVPPRARILSRTIGQDEERARTLGLNPAAPLLVLFRERSIQDRPALVEEIALDAARFQPLSTLPLDAFGDLLYPLYEEVCGLLVVRAAETIRFSQATPPIAAALNIPTGTATAVIDRIAFGIDARPLEWRRSHGEAARFNYTIDLR
ncbi:MAG: GntR family transcriptional regulator [Alphaproteobacteria bacterium]|nr:GntR family transcriptional regulator [Alphaproteobacteria bacterium]